MDANLELREFIERIRQALPEDSARVDELMLGRGYDESMERGYIWVETLADVTNMYIGRREEAALQGHLRLFSIEYDRGSEAVRSCIDVGYAENLMWDCDEADKEWAWPLIPKNLQDLYMGMWGMPPFASS
jgi:hypothetical protein